MDGPETNSLEDLLAEVLALWDTGGEAAVAAFLAKHAQHAAKLRSGIDRCREMGLLGQPVAPLGVPERLGEYRLLRRLGGGGMGVACEAEHTALGRKVALKVIRPELMFHEGARERFRREIQAIARLEHPAIVPVLASEEQDGIPFFAMELLLGKSVDEICTALRGKSPATLALADVAGVLGADAVASLDGPWWRICTRWIHEVALGMRHAHLRGIVHRDLKPSNVMVTPHGQAVVLDSAWHTCTVAESSQDPGPRRARRRSCRPNRSGTRPSTSARTSTRSPRLSGIS